MITVKKEGVVLSTSDLDFENEGVLNPAIIRIGNNVHFFYRAVSKGNLSAIGYCKLDGPLTVIERLSAPFLSPEFEYEKHGMEDPRIVKIDDIYYLSYVAFDGNDALGAVATSSDLRHFEKQGIIVPQLKCSEFDDLAKNNTDIIERYRNDYSAPDTIIMDKDVMFYPRRINGKLAFIHRIKPDMQLVMIKSLADLTYDFWDNYVYNLEENILLTPKYLHEINYVGGGCPPVETEDGWLIIYHGVQHFDTGYQYSACAALFDLDDPRKEISRLPYPLFKPDQKYEINGDVDNVCFPTGTALFDDTLYIYYGAGDEVIACASVSLSGLVDELMTYAVPQSIA
ncbi:MAG: pesticidal protein Cry7Aa [Bacteroidota bacterium]